MLPVSVIREPQQGDSPASVSARLSSRDEANASLTPIILCPSVLLRGGDGPSWHTPPLTLHLGSKKLSRVLGETTAMCRRAIKDRHLLNI